MKGEILSGDELLKLIGKGNKEELSDIYEIYKAGNMSITRINSIYLGTVIQECADPEVIFIRIIKEH